MTGETKIDVTSYVPTDPYFGPAYLDEDEERDEPVPHRMVHGGFEGTDTRFRFYFPSADGYQGRMLNPLFGGHGGTEDFFGGPMGHLGGGLPMAVRLGAYMIESNQGHIGDDVDPKAGDDPGLYGWRASAEAARLSKHVAAQVYGARPHHSYIFGGSGGARRSPLCLENAPDAWDGCVPYMGGGDIAEHGNNNRIKGAQVMSFASMFNVQRLLGTKIDGVVDAMTPGGSGDPFAGLTTHEREELASLYRQGYPRGDEFMIGQPMGQMWLWTSIADMLVDADPTYFDDFWTKPGYVGHDMPDVVTRDLIDRTVTVTRVLTATDLLEDPAFAGPEHQTMRTLVGVMASAANAFDMPFAVELEGVGPGYRQGAGLRVVSGKAAGRQLYCNMFAGDVFYGDGHGEANLLRFTDVLPGDEIHVDNRRFLAFCYFARHHLMDDVQFDSLRVDGRPVHEQHPVPLMSPLMGNSYSGQFAGKLIWVHHTHDASLWPPQGVIYQEAVLGAQGPDGAAERFRLRWTENAEHGSPATLPSPPGRAGATWLVETQPVIEQTLHDLIDWVERGVEPVATSFSYADGKVTLPATAAERGGIQPVVSVTVGGGDRADVRVGEPVTIEVVAEVPPGAGTIVSVDWDFDGSGTFPLRHEGVDGTATRVQLSTTHTYERPGSYFATARVQSHRAGDVNATACRVPNVAQVRIVVS
jgi:PKD domain